MEWLVSTYILMDWKGKNTGSSDLRSLEGTTVCEYCLLKGLQSFTLNELPRCYSYTVEDCVSLYSSLLLQTTAANIASFPYSVIIDFLPSHKHYGLPDLLLDFSNTFPQPEDCLSLERLLFEQVLQVSHKLSYFPPWHAVSTCDNH